MNEESILNQLTRDKQSRIIKLIEKNLPENKDIKILDMGCDKGYLLKRFQELGYTNLFGVDLVDSRIYKHFKFAEANMNSEPIPFKEKFDLITCTEVIEHTENPYNLIRNAHDSLKDNGLLLLSRPHMSNIFNRISFLFRGEVMRWVNNKNNYNLITQKIFDWIIKDKFQIIHKQGDKTVLPLLRLKLPPTILGANSLFYALKKTNNGKE
ncbi:class I SAM-dependent methyltransferase [Candidatus Woesearchaeota archaeon]|nr:class I SAM-dependent methyltransferase [Candidatus Woesearchaeota archaeon]